MYYELAPYARSSAPCILLALNTILLNIFVIYYYRNTRKSFVPMMYMLIASVDIVTGYDQATETLTIVQKCVVRFYLFIGLQKINI